MRVWRIVRERSAAAAFDGEGASRTRNRWNSKGVRIVYTSSSLALAALEVLVHANPTELVGPFIAVSADIPDDVRVKRLPPADLPKNWRTYPAPAELQRIGDDWVKSAGTAALEVPSAVIPLEWNVLLNPAHSEFARVRIRVPIPFEFDPRLGSSHGGR